MYKRAFVYSLGMLLLLLAFSIPCSAAVFKYEDLRLSKLRLPYGEAFTVEGTLEDIRIKVDATTESIDKWLTVAGVTVLVQVKGLDEKTETGQVSGDKWFVPVGALPANAQVTLKFQFTGNLKPDRANTVIDSIIADPAFTIAIDAFFIQAKEKEPNVTALLIQELVKQLTPVIAAHIPPVLEAKPNETFAQAFMVQINKSSLLNLPISVKDLVTVLNGVPAVKDKVKEKMTPSQAFAAVATIEDKDLTPEAKEAVRIFKKNYSSIFNSLLAKATATLPIQSDLGASPEVKDFEKYGGVDMGAIYVPQINELRAFFTVNVYFGPVEEKPAPAAKEATKTQKFGNWLQQRFSLALGVSTGDISGRENSELKGESAFLYGIGFRLNKYFRLTTGAVLYRAADDNRLKNAFFIGPSVDMSAFKYIRDIFAKN